MKKVIRQLLVFAVVVCLLIPLCAPAFAEGTVELGTYGKKAMSAFSVAPDNVHIVAPNGDSNEIKQRLKYAADTATATGDTQMVYVPAGKHPIYAQLKVQKGVILCGEKATIFDSRLPSDSPAAILVWVYGSVYGGTYNCNNTCDTVLRFGDCAFAKPNGYVMYTTITKAKLRGITASGSKTTGCYISYNTVKDVGKDCVGVCNGATVKGIIGNTLSNAVQSGIDIVHANVVTISKNTISNVTGHGISTDTEQKGRTQNYCRITTVTDNKITGAKHHGVYLEKNCKITGHMRGNVITNCTLNGVCIGGKGGNSSIGSSKNKKYFYNNTVQGSGKSNVSIGNTGSVLVMGSGNKITKGKGAGIAIGSGGRVYILGKNNYITYNALNGIQIASGGYIKTYVKCTYINNNRWGVNMNAGGTALLNYCVIKGNSKGSVYYVKGATYRQSHCNMGGKVYCKK